MLCPEQESQGNDDDDEEGTGDGSAEQVDIRSVCDDALRLLEAASDLLGASASLQDTLLDVAWRRGAEIGQEPLVKCARILASRSVFFLIPCFFIFDDHGRLV